jgi:hypothetical protein
MHLDDFRRNPSNAFGMNGGSDGTRTRDLLRDRQAFTEKAGVGGSTPSLATKIICLQYFTRHPYPIHRADILVGPLCKVKLFKNNVDKAVGPRTIKKDKQIQASP